MTAVLSYQPRIDTLMLIDDNDIDQMFYKRIVDRSGLVDTLLQFTDARLALQYLTAQEQPRPDLILLDINMPGMSGFEFLDFVTASNIADISPVIVMLTTSTNPQDETRARSYSAVQEFLNKPLTTQLLQNIAEMLPPP